MRKKLVAACSFILKIILTILIFTSSLFSIDYMGISLGQEDTSVPRSLLYYPLGPAYPTLIGILGDRLISGTFVNGKLRLFTIHYSLDYELSRSALETYNQKMKDENGVQLTGGEEFLTKRTMIEEGIYIHSLKPTGKLPKLGWVKRLDKPYGIADIDNYIIYEYSPTTPGGKLLLVSYVPNESSIISSAQQSPLTPLELVDLWEGAQFIKVYGPSKAVQLKPPPINKSEKQHNLTPLLSLSQNRR